MGLGFSVEDFGRPSSSLSGGWLMRLMLAKLLLAKPDLLLLDEPTNHLDLDMRHALSVALMEYGGALLVISHDRHLLRSVCDDLYIVHNGQLHEFSQSLDEYQNFLKDQDAEPAGKGADSPQTTTVSSKKQNRQDEARRRQQLKPHTDTVRKIDRQMNQQRTELIRVEQLLVDESLYTDADRKEEMTELLLKQARLKSSLDALEWEWLEASEKLEKAEEQL